MVVADSVTAILFSIAKYLGEKHSLMESEVISFVILYAAKEKWVVRVMPPFTEGSMPRLLKTPGDVSSISCRKHQIQDRIDIARADT